MSSTPQTAYDELQSGATFEVNPYREHLRLAYSAEDSGHMSAMRVTELHLVKQMTKLSKHEYLVAHISAQDGTKRYLAVERLRGELLVGHAGSSSSLTSRSDTALAQSTDASAVDHLQNNSPKPSRETSIASLDSLSKKPLNANDVVRAMDGPLHHEKDRTLGRLVFKEDNPLYLYRLAILAVTLHEDAKLYKLFSTNCFWFSGLLVSMLETISDVTFEAGDGKGKGKGKEKGKGKPEGEGIQGQWNGLQVYRDPATPRTDVIAAYKANLLVFEQIVSSGCVVLTSTECSF